MAEYLRERKDRLPEVIREMQRAIREKMLEAAKAKNPGTDSAKKA